MPVAADSGPVPIMAVNPCLFKFSEHGMDHGRLVELDTGGELLTPVVLTLPLQLLAYHVGVARGTDVDQPRNLAKSVTVE